MPKFLKWGVGASVLLLVIYFGVLTLVSGSDFAFSQFREFWYYIITLAAGFGVQVGLYIHLRNLVRSGNGSGKILAVSGTTSTVAMIFCCAHYLGQYSATYCRHGRSDIYQPVSSEVFLGRSSF